MNCNSLNRTGAPCPVGQNRPETEHSNRASRDLISRTGLRGTFATVLARASAFLVVLCSTNVQLSAQENLETRESTASRRDELRFKNGDVLFGKLSSISPRLGVGWTHPDVDESILFGGPAIAEILLGQRTEEISQTNSCRLIFMNRDQIEGDLVGCDADRVVLDTAYAGRLTIPRSRVDTIIPLDAKRKTIFSGPDGLEGWTMGKVSGVISDSGQWAFKDGSFHASKAASIARDVQLPDLSLVQFDLQWKGMFYLAVALHTDYLHPVNLASKDQEPNFGGFYSLQLNTYAANLLAVKKLDPIKYLGQIAVNSFNQKSSAHIEIRSNRHKKTIALLVDGQLIKQWSDNEDFAGKGSGLRFVHQGQGSIKLSRLTVSEWDGQFEEPRSHPWDSRDDLAKLRNGDRVLGRVEKIENSQMLVVTGTNKLTVPLNRIKQIELAGTGVESGNASPHEVRASLRRGGTLTFKLENWTTNGVEILSTNLGRVTCSPAIFDRVVFGPKALGPLP